MENTNEIIIRIPAPSDGIETVLLLVAIGALLTAVLGVFQHWKKIASLLSSFPWKRASKTTNALSLMALIIVGPAAVGLFVLAVVEAYALLGTKGGSGTSAGTFGRGAVIVALIGAPFVIWRSIVAQKTVNVTEQGHITDRINTAVQGLGAEKVVSRVWRNVSFEKDGEVVTEFEGREKGFEFPKDATNKKRGEWKVADRTQPNLEVRIGAIYALERIAQDSDRDHVQIMEILCAYIRENAPASQATELIPKDLEKAVFYRKIPGGTEPREDIQTAITVISRRRPEAIKKERGSSYRLDLTNCNLQNAKFNIGSGQWGRAIFDGSRLDQATFENCNCLGTSFKRCGLANTNFGKTILTGANMDLSDIRYLQISDHSNNIALLYSVRELATTFETCLFQDLAIGNEFHTTFLANSTFIRCMFRHAWFFQTLASLEPKGCKFAHCAIRGCKFDENTEIDFDLRTFFGDGSSILPEELRPDFWPRYQLSDEDFEKEWRKWQADPESYDPPDPPAEADGE